MRRRMAEGSGIGWRDALLIVGVIALLSAIVGTQVAHAETGDTGTLAQALGRASQRFERENYAAALEEYRRATELDPGSIAAWRGYGWSLWHLDRDSEAYAVWKDILKVQPGDTETLVALA